MVKPLNGRAEAHTVLTALTALTALDDQKLFWLRLRAQFHMFLRHIYFFKSIIKIFQILLSPK